VFIHDAARPLINNEHIESLSMACKKSDGAILAHPVSDTLKKINNQNIDFTVDRKNLWLAETPQAFNLAPLKTCYKNMDINDRKIFTDEASLMEHNGYSVQIVHNKNMNIKITEIEDIALVKGMLYQESRVGIGVDFHSLIKGDHLVVGGYKINCEFSSDAHSDGDVLTHAITDALLGALNLGDIGEHFPNTPEYLNISSIELLQKIIKKIPNNVKIAMIDVSIVLNKPKISPHKQAIKASLSEKLGIDKNIISIKATTTNGLKFLDMTNGWGCEAIVTLNNEN
jgi:2-C-methyl-D-erythritol 4-phosphate cytidylyltransferase/2-C-methyl-D-erythritol 2,4-cyclodiphosphate synthase